MVRARNGAAKNRRRKRLLKQAKGYFGDRKNHLKNSRDAVMKALDYHTRHRKQRKTDFRQLWIVRLGVAAKANGLSYNRLISGLKVVGSTLNRQMLSEMAIRDPMAFTLVAETAKSALSKRA